MLCIERSIQRELMELMGGGRHYDAAIAWDVANRLHFFISWRNWCKSSVSCYCLHQHRNENEYNWYFLFNNALDHFQKEPFRGSDSLSICRYTWPLQVDACGFWRTILQVYKSDSLSICRYTWPTDWDFEVRGVTTDCVFFLYTNLHMIHTYFVRKYVHRYEILVWDPSHERSSGPGCHCYSPCRWRAGPGPGHCDSDCLTVTLTVGDWHWQSMWSKSCFELCLGFKTVQ